MNDREELRGQFEKEELLHWTNDDGEPEIEYVEWLENRIAGFHRPSAVPMVPSEEQILEAMASSNDREFNAKSIHALLTRSGWLDLSTVEKHTLKNWIANQNIEAGEWLVRFSDLQPKEGT